MGGVNGKETLFLTELESTVKHNVNLKWRMRFLINLQSTVSRFASELNLYHLLSMEKLYALILVLLLMGCGLRKEANFSAYNLFP